jgi:hypothetical protein
MARPEDRGEHPNGRQAVDALTQRFIDSGAKPDVAKKRAIETALRHDRRRENGA